MAQFPGGVRRKVLLQLLLLLCHPFPVVSACDSCPPRVSMFCSLVPVSWVLRRAASLCLLRRSRGGGGVLHCVDTQVLGAAAAV